MRSHIFYAFCMNIRSLIITDGELFCLRPNLDIVCNVSTTMLETSLREWSWSFSSECILNWEGRTEFIRRSGATCSNSSTASPFGNRYPQLLLWSCVDSGSKLRTVIEGILRFGNSSKITTATNMTQGSRVEFVYSIMLSRSQPRVIHRGLFCTPSKHPPSRLIPTGECDGWYTVDKPVSGFRQPRQRTVRHSVEPFGSRHHDRPFIYSML